MAKQLTVVWDELTRHTQTFTVDDDFPEKWSPSGAISDGIADKLEELVKDKGEESAASQTLALNVQEFHAA